MGITYEEKRSLEFQDHWGQAPYAKTELQSLESFLRIGYLTYSYFSNRCGIDASPFMDSNTKSLSLIHLAVARASHLAFAIQGDP